MPSFPVLRHTALVSKLWYCHPYVLYILNISSACSVSVEIVRYREVYLVTNSQVI